MTNSILNLDWAAATYAQKMVETATAEGKKQGVRDPIGTLERLATKTLGVLQEQGVYAMMLFLYSRSSDEEKIAPAIRAPLFSLLRDDTANHHIPGFAEKSVPDDGADDKQGKAAAALDFYSQYILQDLDTLLLVREIYEQTLIYARYGAKAAKAAANDATRREETS